MYFSLPISRSQWHLRPKWLGIWASSRLRAARARTANGERSHSTGVHASLRRWAPIYLSLGQLWGWDARVLALRHGQVSFIRLFTTTRSTNQIKLTEFWITPVSYPLHFLHPLLLLETQSTSIMKFVPRSTAPPQAASTTLSTTVSKVRLPACHE